MGMTLPLDQRQGGKTDASEASSKPQLLAIGGIFVIIFL